MGDKVGAPSSVAEGLLPGVGDGLTSGCFPLRHHRPEGLPEAFMWQSCNLTGHVTRKFRDSVRGVEKSANCTSEKNRGKSRWGGGVPEDFAIVPVRTIQWIGASRMVWPTSFQGGTEVVLEWRLWTVLAGCCCYPDFTSPG